MTNSANDVETQIQQIYSQDSRRILATLIRLIGDFDLAEEAMQEAFLAAAQSWQDSGVPENPRSWLVSTGRFKAVDRLRRQTRLREKYPEVAARLESIAEQNIQKADHAIQDDRLRLIFTCCHPAIDLKIQVPLTMREVCGVSTDAIAHAFLTSPKTMAQRIVRGKAKIRYAGIAFHLPTQDALPERLNAVLAVIYLVFNEGYSASSGLAMTRSDLSAEAIRLGRLLLELLPEPEVYGLVALMLYQESRRETRTDAQGDIVLLEEQDRDRWNQPLIEEGNQMVRKAMVSGPIGTYTLQAAIANVHANARSAKATDWPRITAIYDQLIQLQPSPIVELNRAVAIAMRDGPEAGLAQIDQILNRGQLNQFHLAHAARGDLLRRSGKWELACQAYQDALRFARQEPEIRFLQRRISEMKDSP